MIENDNTYAKSCILYSKDVYISVTQSKYILVCVCACVRAFVRVRAHVRAYVHTFVRKGVLEHTNGAYKCAHWSLFWQLQNFLQRSILLEYARFDIPCKW